MAAPQDVTLVKNAVHNPNEPRHFMRIVPAGKRWVAAVGEQVIADSNQALVVKEVGGDIYDPVVYFPRSDVNMAMLAPIDKTTHCPLKGDTEYFDVTANDQRLTAAAWSYVDMVAGHELLELVAFDAGQVTCHSSD